MKKEKRKSRPLRYRTIGSPIGDLGLVASERGLVSVSFNPKSTGQQLAQTKLGSPSNPDREDDGIEVHLDRTERQINEYFAGSLTAFSLILDLYPRLPGPNARANPFVSSSHRFYTQAQIALLSVGYAKTATYGDIAKLLGSPKSARAVGTACATNPIPLVIPCHRIIRSDGTLGQYAGGVEVKTYLIELEERNQIG